MTSLNQWKPALIAAVLFFATMAPFGTVFAQANYDVNPDGFIAVIKPRLATGDDSGILLQSSGNMYVADFAFHHVDGSPYLVTEYAVDIHTIDGRAPNAINEDYPTLVWTGVFTMTAGSQGVFRIPANEVIFHTPMDNEMVSGGVSITILAHKGALGERLRVGTTDHYPSASFSAAANAFAAQGRWTDADRAGEGFTPTFLLNAQLAGLVEPGNPLLNPGFEVGAVDLDVPGPLGLSGSFAPWFMRADNGGDVDGDGNDDHYPHSSHSIVGAAGVSGSAVKITYDTRDNGRNVYLGQFLSPPTTDAVWVGTSDVKVSFDVRMRDVATGASAARTFAARADIHATGGTVLGQEIKTATPTTGPVPVDTQWHRVTNNFGTSLDGAQIMFLALSFQDAFTANTHVYIDNVRITGLVLQSGVNPKNDNTDGYSAFIFPHALNMPAGQEAIQQQTVLGNGARGYVYTIAAMDYTGVDPKQVDVASNRYSWFQLVDEAFIPSMSHNPSDVVFHAATDGANAQSFFRYLDSTGAVSDNLLVVVPASYAGADVAPWMFSDIAIGDTYTNTYGTRSEPVHGFHSAARNQLMGHGFADALDTAFTPLRLSSLVGDSMRHGATLTISCPGMTSTVTCADSDPDPDMVLTYTSSSKVFETVTLELRAVHDGHLIGSANVATPGGGSVTIEVSAAEVAAMEAAGDLRVYAETAGSVFSDGASTGLFQLENLAPVARFTVNGPADLKKNDRVTLSDGSTDSDGVVSRVHWTVTFDDDPTPDGDADAPSVIREVIASRSTGIPASILATMKDDGNYTVTLTVFDDGLASDTATATLVVRNVAPEVTLVAPAFVRAGAPISFPYTVRDHEGFAPTMSFDAGDGTFAPLLTPGAATATFATPGPVVIRIRAVDEDGDVTIVSKSLIVDGDKPTTTLTVLDTPTGENGWHIVAPKIRVERADATSGVASTQLTAGAIETVTGDETFERTVTNRGITVVSAFSTDNAGNVGDAVDATVKFDNTAPVATITGPAFAGPIGEITFTGRTVTITVKVVEDGAPIRHVEFYVDGGAPLAVVTTGVNGVYTFDWIAAGSGVHQIAAVAVNDAGLLGITQQVNVLVV